MKKAGVAVKPRKRYKKTTDSKHHLPVAYFRRKPPKGLLHHSDRGSQYASCEYQQMLESYGMRCSMSRKGDCWDNAAVESFFHLLKTEWIKDTVYLTRDEARADVVEYIEIFYNNQRRHSFIDYMSPNEYEKQILVSKAA